MRELELDGIHEDGEHLLLGDSDGQRYTLRIDKALRAAVRTDRPALNMIRAEDSAPVRPREIQALLRSGRSAEDIAEESEIPLEHVRRYEGPVLAEREWTAQRARTFPVTRGGPALDEVVSERLLAREATGDVAWDAWRRPDGTWTLELSFSAGGRTRQAHWVADLDNRSVAAVDDEARWISDEDAPSGPQRGRARLQAVKSAVYDLEADGSLEGEPTPEPRSRTWPPHRPVSEEHPSVIDDEELEALNARRGLRSVPRPDEASTVWSDLDDAEASPGPAAAEDPVTESDPDREAELEHSSAPAAPEHPDLGDETLEDSADAADEASAEADDRQGSEPVSAYQDTVDLTPLPGFDDAGTGSGSEQESADQDAGEDSSQDAAKKPSKGSKSRSKRTAMPSWDEIVFGSKHD